MIQFKQVETSEPLIRFYEAEYQGKTIWYIETRREQYEKNPCSTCVNVIDINSNICESKPKTSKPKDFQTMAIDGVEKIPLASGNESEPKVNVKDELSNREISDEIKAGLIRDIANPISSDMEITPKKPRKFNV